MQSITRAKQGDKCHECKKINCGYNQNDRESLMKLPFKAFPNFILLTTALFLTCATRDNQFDPSSPLYIGSPPKLVTTCDLEPSVVIKNNSMYEYVVRPGAIVSFKVNSYDIETKEPLPINLKVIHNTIVTSTSDDISNLDSLVISLGDSGTVEVVFTSIDQNNLKSELVYTFFIMLNRKPSIQEFKPLVITENIVWVGKKSYVDFRTEILDPDSLLDSIVYILAPDSLPDSICYIYDTSKSDKRVATSASMYVDTVSLECYSDTAVDAYVIAIITDKLGRKDSTKSVIYFNPVDLSKRPEIDSIIYEIYGKDSNIVCFQTLATVHNGTLDEALYTYDFGNGDPKPLKNFYQCYPFTTPGNHTVKVSVTDDGGASDTASVSVMIPYPKIIIPAKILKLISTPDSGNMPLKVNFQIELSDESSKDVTVTWKFGVDNGEKFGKLKEDFTYFYQGNYNVRAVVSSIGGNDTAYDTVHVCPKYIRYYPSVVNVGWAVAFWLENYNQPHVKLLRWTIADSVIVKNIQDAEPVSISIKNPGWFDAKVEAIPDSGAIPFPMPIIESIKIWATSKPPQN